MSSLPLSEIQGLILRSYGMDALRLFVLKVRNADAARPVLGKVPVTSGAIWDKKPDFCVNVAITYEGLAALQVPAASLAGFPAEFAAGSVRRAAIVGDTGASDPRQWKQALAGPGVHVIVLLFSQTKDILEAQTAALRKVWSGADVLAEVFVQDSGMLPNNLAHFGYRDGFSQPTIDGGLPNPVPEILPNTAAGEFVLGYPSQYDQFTYPVPSPLELGLNGSFLALRILEQDCTAFDRALKEAPQKYGISGEKLAAKMCGRWRNGVPLALSPDTDTPTDPIPVEKINSFDYVPTSNYPQTYNDARGYRCPVGSHMRRNNPRSSTVAGGGGLKHRIIRRGLPYGPPFDPTHPDDGIERGLLGLFIGVSLKDQFEFLMSEWVNGDTFASGVGGTRDPVLGNGPDGEGKFVIPVENASPIVVSGFPRFVTTRGSAYAFIPSLTGLRYIASLQS
jgi:deferrochelatase/peroxidase EfeB